MTKYIINNITYTSKTAQPHNHLRNILIDAKLNGYEFKSCGITPARFELKS